MNYVIDLLRIELAKNRSRRSANARLPVDQLKANLERLISEEEQIRAAIKILSALNRVGPK